MNNQKRPATKKTLVRNTSVTTVGKSVTVAPSLTRPSTSKASYSLGSQISKLSLESENCCSNVASKASSHSLQSKQSFAKVKFNTPELQSTLKLSKKIDEVVNPRRTKSTSDIEKNRLAIDEKVTRKVNQPLYKPVFKDLIPISNYEPKTQKVVHARVLKPPRDPEPKLEDFLEPRKVRDYVSIPKIDSKVLSNCSAIRDPPNHNLRLYNLIQLHTETKISDR